MISVSKYIMIIFTDHMQSSSDSFVRMCGKEWELEAPALLEGYFGQLKKTSGFLLLFQDIPARTGNDAEDYQDDKYRHQRVSGEHAVRITLPTDTVRIALKIRDLLTDAVTAGLRAVFGAGLIGFRYNAPPVPTGGFGKAQSHESCYFRLAFIRKDADSARGVHDC